MGGDLKVDPGTRFDHYCRAALASTAAHGFPTDLKIETMGELYFSFNSDNYHLHNSAKIFARS
jgi:hypothetical protein